MELAHEGIMVDRRTNNKRLLEQGLMSPMRRKKPRLTQKNEALQDINGL